MSTSIRTYRELKKQIQKKDGDITKIAHCKSLSNNIFTQTGERISESTLFRIFTDNPSHTPYEYTLDVLCRYIGYGNWLSFKQATENEGAYEENSHQISLLQICLENNNADTVVQFLKTLPDDYSMGMPSILQISHVIGRAIRESKGLQQGLMPKLTTFEQGRIYFTETFVDHEYFDEYYRKNLKLYLKTQVKNPIKKVDDELFALNLLFWDALRKNDKAKIYCYSKLLKPYEVNPLIKQEKNHSLPLFRFRLFLLVQKYLSRKISSSFFVNAAFRLYEEFNKKESRFKPVYIRIVCDFFIYLGFYSEAIQLYDVLKEEDFQFLHNDQKMRKEMDLLKIKLAELNIFNS